MTNATLASQSLTLLKGCGLELISCITLMFLSMFLDVGAVSLEFAFASAAEVTFVGLFRNEPTG